MEDSSLSTLGKSLETSLATIAAHDDYEKSLTQKDMLHIPHASNGLITAYEQLRSVAENIEDHMLTQAAIMRFYRRNLIFTKSDRKLGNELITELTQAGYLENNSVPLTKVGDLDAIIAAYSTVRKQLNARQIPSNVADAWTLELLSVKSEQLLTNPIRVLSFAHFAHNYFTQYIDYNRILAKYDIPAAEYPKLLYIAIHKELLKSDDANARSGLLDLYAIPLHDIDQFIAFNQVYDAYSRHNATIALSRFVTRNGAPLRVIRSSYFEKSDEYRVVKIEARSKTLQFLDTQIEHIYKQTKRSAYHGIVQSIMFLLVARALIGILIEIPYDIATTGAIATVPLIANVVIPSLFLVISVVTFKRPGTPNKDALKKHITSVIYNDAGVTLSPLRYPQQQKKNYAFEIFLGLTFILAFYLIISRLQAFDYTILQGALFLLFFSSANFLGYRLTLQTKELELVSTNQGFIAMIRDFLYFPFIFVGKRIAHRSQKINLVALILDIVIDLPLKTIVRLVRQWLGFIQTKKDDL